MSQENTQETTTPQNQPNTPNPTQPQQQTAAATEPKLDKSDPEYALKNALINERKRADEAERKAKEAEARASQYNGLDIEKALSAIKYVEEDNIRKLTEAQNWSELEKQKDEKHRQTLDSFTRERDEREKKLQNELSKIMISNEIEREFNAQKGKAKSQAVFSEIAAKFVELDFDSEKVDYKFSLDKVKNISDLVKSLKNTEEYGIFFDSEVATGSGSPAQRQTGSQPAGSLKVKKQSELAGFADRSRYIQLYGLHARKDPAVPALMELPK